MQCGRGVRVRGGVVLGGVGGGGGRGGGGGGRGGRSWGGTLVGMLTGDWWRCDVSGAVCRGIGPETV